MGRTDAIRVGVGMVPRGEVGMVVAQIGLNMGVMAQSVYGIIVFMSVATTLIAPPLLKLAFGGADRSRNEEMSAWVDCVRAATISERDQVHSLPIRLRRLLRHPGRRHRPRDPAEISSTATRPPAPPTRSPM